MPPSAVVKLRLLRLKSRPLSLSQFSLATKLEVLKHGPLLGGQSRPRLQLCLQLWLERDAACVGNMTRAATPAGRDLPGDGRRAGRPPAGQQGVRVAQARQELEGGCAQMEATQMQELAGVRADSRTTAIDIETV